MNTRPTDHLVVALAQLNPVVGDITRNAQKASRTLAEAASAGAHLVMFPELYIGGYPPEDLVLKPGYQAACRRAVEDLARETASGPAMLMGSPWVDEGRLYNAYLLLHAGRIEAVRYKVDLPNYGVFDEKRVFAAGPMPGPIVFNGVRIGIPICEDIWGPEPVECIAETGGEILLVPNGSPYRRGVIDERLNVAVARGTAVGGLARERLDGGAARRLEGRLEHQVLGRIAGDEQLGIDHEIGALPRRGGAGAACLLGIAGDITDGRVELRDGDREAVGWAWAHGRDVASRGASAKHVAPESRRWLSPDR